MGRFDPMATPTRMAAIGAFLPYRDRPRAAARDRFDPFAARQANDRSLRILLKNSEIEGRQKSRFRAHSVVYASRCHSKAYERVAHSKTGRSAEALRKFPSRLPAVL